jgi:hypothetical protein
MGTLRDLFDLYKCDKGSSKHLYDRVYEPYMEEKRHDQINILEIGCFRGESTAAWLEYFPNATIYTIDIFDRVSTNDIEVLKDERVRWLRHDSMNANLPNAIRKAWGNDIEFEFIIDDGAHWPEANRLTFQNCFQFLSKTGSYFIEDVWMLDKGDNYQSDWVRRHSDRYVMGEHIRLMTLLERPEYNLKHYDYSQEIKRNKRGFDERIPDCYILRIQHADG